MDAVEKLEKKVGEMPRAIIEQITPIIQSELSGLELRLQLTYSTHITELKVKQDESKERISGVELKYEKLESDNRKNATGLEVLQAVCEQKHKDGGACQKPSSKIPQNIVKIGVPLTAIGAVITWLISKLG